jgi:hypothetical protein
MTNPKFLVSRLANLPRFSRLRIRWETILCNRVNSCTVNLRKAHRLIFLSSCIPSYHNLIETQCFINQPCTHPFTFCCVLQYTALQAIHLKFSGCKIPAILPSATRLRVRAAINAAPTPEPSSAGRISIGSSSLALFLAGQSKISRRALAPRCLK